MIRGVHTMFYTADAVSLRAFLRDTLGFTSCTDVGEGWLIFDLPEADMGCHPSSPPNGLPGTHQISFYCDDIHATVAELRGRGVRFIGEVSDQGYGLVTRFEMPGGVEVELYQPHYSKGAGAD